MQKLQSLLRDLLSVCIRLPKSRTQSVMTKTLVMVTHIQVCVWVCLRVFVQGILVGAAPNFSTL